MTLPKVLKNLLSPKEEKELLTRLKVASLLQKKVTYREITKQTGAGAATIARIAKRLKKGRGEVRLARNPRRGIPVPQNHYAFGSSQTL
jgi:uncharacterized protein YerC